MSIYGNVIGHCYKETSHTDPPEIREGCTLKKPQADKTCVFYYEFRPTPKYCVRGYKAETSFEYSTSTKTPTHDLTPYIGTRWSIYSTGSWLDIKMSLKNYSTNRFASDHSLEFDTFYIHESLKPHMHEKTVPSVLKSQSLPNQILALEIVPEEPLLNDTIIHLTGFLSVLGPKAIEFENSHFRKVYHKRQRWYGTDPSYAPDLISIEADHKIAIPFSTSSSSHILSLQGILYFLSLRSNIYNTLNLYWLQNSQKTDPKSFAAFPKKCQQRQVPPKYYCLYFSIMDDSKHYLYLRQNVTFFSKPNHLKNFMLRKKKLSLQMDKMDLKSWVKASEICKSLVAKLPIFRSRDDFNEFTSLIKLSGFIPPVEAVFIRIMSKKGQKVSVPGKAACWSKHMVGNHTSSGKKNNKTLPNFLSIELLNSLSFCTSTKQFCFEQQTKYSPGYFSPISGLE